MLSSLKSTVNQKFLISDFFFTKSDDERVRILSLGLWIDEILLFVPPKRLPLSDERRASKPIHQAPSAISIVLPT